MDGQRELLEAIGVVPLPPTGGTRQNPQGGLWRLRAGRGGPRPSTKARTGSVTVPRAHVERLEDGTEVKPFLSNSKSRRGKLRADKLQQLADLGLEWAA